MMELTKRKFECHRLHPLDYWSLVLAGKPKGIKCELKGRGLWPERGLIDPAGSRQGETFVIRRDAAKMSTVS